MAGHYNASLWRMQGDMGGAVQDVMIAQENPKAPSKNKSRASTITPSGRSKVGRAANDQRIHAQDRVDYDGFTRMLELESPCSADSGSTRFASEPWEWEEEYILKHLRDGSPAPSNEEVRSDQLGPALRAVTPVITEDNVRTLVPAVKKAAAAFENARSTDARFTVSMLSVNDSIQQSERHDMQVEDVLKKHLHGYQERKSQLLAQLKQTIAARDDLLTQYEEQVEDIVRRATEDLQEHSQDFDQRIEYWDKKYREMDKVTKGKKKTESVLKDLLSKLS